MTTHCQTVTHSGSSERQSQLISGETNSFEGKKGGCQLQAKGLVIITGRGGAQNGKIAGPKLFGPPP